MEEIYQGIEDRVFREKMDELRVLYEKFYELNIHKGLLNYQIKKREWIIEREYLLSRRTLIEKSLKTLNPNEHTYGKHYYRMTEELEENTLELDMNRVKEPGDSEKMEEMIMRRDEYLIEFEKLRERLSKKYDIKIPTYLFNPGTLSKEFTSCIVEEIE
jgi:hypothetical protein